MIQIRESGPEDLPQLAEMNRELNQEIRMEMSLQISQLEKRLEADLAAGQKAFLFFDKKRVYGYALCDPQKTPLFIRQFFIKPPDRRKGIGRKMFFKLLKIFEASLADVEVNVWNQVALLFFESLGFEKQFYSMRYNQANPRLQ